MILESFAFCAFILAFLFGVLAGYVLHAILRAPRWLVGSISE